MVGDSGGDEGLVVVSNREPVVHSYTADGIARSRPTGGLVSALDEVVADLGGTWVAWGSGDADFDQSVAPDGTLSLPPDDPAYTLRRVNLSRQQVDGYYYGYSNQVLWPLCHLDTNYVDVRPGFWETYEAVNAEFADAVAAAADGPVWVQDYHLTRLPRLLRERGFDGGPVVQFWHVPWPPAEVFAICPQAEQVLDGLLGADALGFHTEQYRTNFLDSVARLVPDADPDRERGVVERGGRTTRTYVAPVGVDTDAVAARARDGSADHWRRLVRSEDVGDATVAVGVDRLDYTKGILERLDALERLWATTPRLRGDLVYVQTATRTREGIAAYRAYHGEVRDRVYDLNQRFGTDDWTPVVYTEADLARDELLGLYRHADVAVVSSRKDGLNLVAPEFVAASRGAGGVLVLSEFTGAAEHLGEGAVTVNPFDTASFADRLVAAVEMDEDERGERFAALTDAVGANDVSDWIAANRRQFERGAPADGD
ncbi:MAG: trehalose-6-phosphate synthase [Halorientalis sp.]